MSYSFRVPELGITLVPSTKNAAVTPAVVGAVLKEDAAGAVQTPNSQLPPWL